MTPRALGHGSESPGSPGRHRGHSDPNRVARETCRHSRPSGMGANTPGPLVDPRVLWKFVLVAQGLLVDPSGLGPGQESPGTTSRPQGPSDPNPSRPGELVDPGWLGPSASRPKQEFDPTAPRARSRVTQESWSTPRAVGHGPKSPGTVGPPREPSEEDPSHLVELVNRTRPSDPGPSCLGQLVDPRGPRTQQRDTRDSWSTPWALGTVARVPRDI